MLTKLTNLIQSGQLKQVQADADALVTSSGCAIVGLDREGVIRSWNPAAQQLYGYSTPEVLGKSVEVVVAEGALSWLARAARGERILDQATQARRKDGSFIAIALTASPILDDEGTTVGIVSISHDITERKESDEEARRLAAIVKSSSDAVIGKTPEGVITSWNSAAEVLFGYSRQEAVGQRSDLIVPPNRSDEEHQLLTRLMAGEHVREFATERRHKDGTIVPVSLSASAVRGAAGEVIGVATINRDMTERRGAEVLHSRLAAIVEASVDAIVGFDLDGVITNWNPAARRLLGYPAVDVIGRHMSLFVSPEHKDEQQRTFARALRGVTVRHWETEGRRQDGTLVPLSVTLSLLRAPGGAPIGVAGVLRDMSDRRRYEHERHIAATLQRSLLPEASPDVPGLAVATRYFPGGAGLEVGGDWYDVFELPGRRLGVAVGDVIGRGIGAAAVMGQLRTALRAYALELSTPATVLASLSRLASSLDESQMATVLYGVVDPNDGGLELASAGHPPPLVVAADGEVSFMDVDGAPPLGVLELPPTQVVEQLGAGTVLLFYTDGLIERRGASIEDGMAALASAAAGATDAESLCKQVSKVLDVEDSPDDVALLALSLDTAHSILPRC